MRGKTATALGYPLRRIMSAAAGGVALGAAVVSDIPSATAFSESIHARITRNAFPFMTGSVLSTIVAGNHDEDEGAAENLAERHAQNCRFRDSADYANMRYRQVVDALRAPQSNDPNRAARLFGHILHGVQDFYSHANWIPTPPQGLGIRDRLLESGLGLWKKPEPYSVLFGDVVVIEGDPPEGVTARLPRDANGRISSAIPIVTDRRIFGAPAVVDRARTKSGVVNVDGRRYRGLMTSAAPREGVDQQCPPVAKNQKNCSVDDPENVCLRHGEGRASDTSRRTFDGVGNLNLDHEGDGDWFQARHYARLQSRHEWCRLLHLSRDLDPTFVAAGRLLATWVGTDFGANTPHIPGTACQRGAVRRHGVEISATPGPDAPQSVPFVVFRSDFTSSARTTVGRQATKTLRICGSTNERIVATLMPTLTEGSTFVVPVPATARSWTVRDHRGGFLVTFTVKVTPNSC